VSQALGPTRCLSTSTSNTSGSSVTSRSSSGDPRLRSAMHARHSATILVTGLSTHSWAPASFADAALRFKRWRTKATKRRGGERRSENPRPYPRSSERGKPDAQILPHHVIQTRVEPSFLQTNSTVWRAVREGSSFCDTGTQDLAHPVTGRVSNSRFMS